MPDVIQNLAGYTISLVDGFPQCINGQQTWRYRVEFADGAPDPAISNIAFQLCANHNVIDIVSPEGTLPEVSTNPQPCLDILGAPKQIKWDTPNGNDTIGENGAEFQFTLDACFEPTDINVALKAGNTPPNDGCNFGVITGPSCEEAPPPPPGRGIRFDKLDTAID